MKAGYEKPVIEFQEYELNTTIAAGCQTIVSLGPGNDTHPVCKEYEVDFGPQTYSAERPINFYEDSCACYLSAGVGTLMKS